MKTIAVIMGEIGLVLWSIITIAFCVIVGALVWAFPAMFLWGFAFVYPLNSFAETLFMLLIFAGPAIGFAAGCKLAWSFWVADKGSQSVRNSEPTATPDGPPQSG